MRIGFSGTGTVVGRTESARPEYEIPPEPDMMGNDTAELACRRGAGIEVTLLWHRASGKLTVTVSDAASGAAFDCPSLRTRRSPPSTTPTPTPPSREWPTKDL